MQPIKTIYVGERDNSLWEKSESLAKRQGFRSRSELILKLLERFDHYSNPDLNRGSNLSTLTEEDQDEEARISQPVSPLPLP